MKQVIQGFATALLLAGAIMLYFHYTEAAKTEQAASAEPQMVKPDNDEMKQELEGQGYHVLDDKEYNQLTGKQTGNAAKSEPEQQKKTYTLKLENGMTSGEVASSLEKAGIIEDGAAFRTYLDVTEASQSLQVGKYDLDSDMDYKEIVELMTK
ncbi:endolytic transglycosylase MltG [Terribacillus sp. 7520-G]|uniref:endolytic transglycosylase MltG n=1 Tax=unclassified Terribacillus TaxID=2636508 RepID=UPI000BA5F5B3|nr:endolytic transglycosylase MltG [Terribacillus sp. 7520-G]PAD39250.1 hypothetical protein CHH53_06990 [Terribacillus sp. 7520-G]